MNRFENTSLSGLVWWHFSSSLVTMLTVLASPWDIARGRACNINLWHLCPNMSKILDIERCAIVPLCHCGFRRFLRLLIIVFIVLVKTAAPQHLVYPWFILGLSFCETSVNPRWQPRIDNWWFCRSKTVDFLRDPRDKEIWIPGTSMYSINH